MKKEKNYFIADFYKTPEEITLHKKQIDEDMQETLKMIKAGRIYATVSHVSASGMSRRIKFYYVKNNHIIRATAQVAWLSKSVMPGQHKQGKKYLNEEGLMVRGVGMDMISHILYKCMPYSQAKKWNQNYNTL